MKTKTISMALFMLISLFLSACEKGFNAEEEPAATKAEGNVTLLVKSIEMIPFENTTTTRASEMSQLCSRLQFVVFKNGEKQKSISQQQGDADFGQATVSLPEGDYQLVVMGHSCTGVATITNLEKITFPNNKVTDTFYYYGTFTVGSDSKTVELELHRAVAMFRLKLSEPLAENVHQLKFYYTGGSSTFSAVSGFGSVNSKQTEIRDVSSGQTVFEVYTFPHEQSDNLKITITALDASGADISEQVMENVPVKLNNISQYTGSLFGETTGKSTSPSISVKGDGEWEGTITVN